MTTTSNSASWATVGIVFLALTRICPSVHFHQIRTQTLANGVAALCLLFAMPFFAYSLFGHKSWTGMALSPPEKRRIDGLPGHAVGMYLWLFSSAFQLLSNKKKAGHKVVGKAVFLGILPVCLLEIATNAVHVFLPNKPKYLAQFVLQKEDVAPSEILAFSNVFSVPLLVPLGVGLHGYFAARNIWPRGGDTAKRNIRLHTHHIMCAIVWMLSAGMVRLFLKAAFYLELGGCREHTGDPLDAIPIQAAMCLPTGILLVSLLNGLFMTLPPTLKRDAAVECMRLFWIWYVMHMIVASALLHVEMIPNCRAGRFWADRAIESIQKSRI
jgi:hypothetical protein